MNLDKKNTSGNLQDGGHQEGQMNNTPPRHDADGQRRSDNNSQSMDNMLKGSEDQKTSGSKEGQSDQQE